MIKFSFRKLPVDEDGKAYDNLEAFQAEQLRKLLGITHIEDKIHTDIVAHKAEVIEILQLTMDARPSARGQKRPRKSKSIGTLPLEQSAA